MGEGGCQWGFSTSLSRKYLRGTEFPFIRIVLAVGNFGSEMRRSGTFMQGGILDIPFPRPVRDALLDDGLAEEHHWIPNSGWISYYIRSNDNFQHALWLTRLSYLRYALKNAADSRQLFETESARLRLSARFRLLLEPFVRQAISESIQPLTA